MLNNKAQDFDAVAAAETRSLREQFGEIGLCKQAAVMTWRNRTGAPDQCKGYSLRALSRPKFAPTGDNCLDRDATPFRQRRLCDQAGSHLAKHQLGEAGTLPFGSVLPR